MPILDTGMSIDAVLILIIMHWIYTAELKGSLLALRCYPPFEVQHDDVGRLIQSGEDKGFSPQPAL